MTAWIAVAAVGVGTYASRAVFILALARRRIPASVIRGLEQVGPATLAALIVAMLITDGEVQAGVPEIGGLAAGAVVGLRWKNLIVMLIAGMGAFWLLRAWS